MKVMHEEYDGNVHTPSRDRPVRQCIETLDRHTYVRCQYIPGMNVSQ